jgi:hypothetical protein
VELASAVLQAAGHSCTTEQFLVLVKVGSCLCMGYMGEYVTWTFSPNNNGIAHQGRAG